MKPIIYIVLVLILSSCAFQRSIPSIESFDDLQYPYPVKKADLDDGKQIAYMDEGEGEVLLFIHGLGSYAPAWKENILTLSQSYRCIAIDLPGYGKSSKGKYEAKMSSYADIVKAFVQKMNLSKVNLVGHSMGGQIAIMVSLAYPDIVDRLILVAPAGFETFSPGQKEWFRDVLTPTAVKLTSADNIKANIGWNFHDIPKSAYFMITDRIAMKSAKDFDAYCYIIPQCVKGMVDEPVFDYLENVTQPTLVIFGKSDNLIPNRYLNPGHTEDYALLGANKIPNSQLEMIDNAGHFVHFEKAAEVNSFILQFLK